MGLPIMTPKYRDWYRADQVAPTGATIPNKIKLRESTTSPDSTRAAAPAMLPTGAERKNHVILNPHRPRPPHPQRFLTRLFFFAKKVCDLPARWINRKGLLVKSFWTKVHYKMGHQVRHV